MDIIRDIEACRSALGWRRGQRRVGMVIIRGRLHPGHLAIVNQCRRECDITLVCIAPRPAEDPDTTAINRSFNDDAAQLEALKVDFLFRPEYTSLFPCGTEQTARVVMPALPDAILQTPATASELATLLLKLISIVSPDCLFVGEKDFPAWMTCRQLIETFSLPVEFCSVPIIREADGLPAAEDLQRLSAEQRRTACVLQQTMRDLAHAITNGARNYSKLEQTAKLALRGAGFNIRYVIVRDEQTLALPDSNSKRLRILAQAQFGPVSITDNLSVSL
jgi:pantoate--beta-alanine ligase